MGSRIDELIADRLRAAERQAALLTEDLRHIRDLLAIRGQPDLPLPDATQGLGPSPRKHQDPQPGDRR